MALPALHRSGRLNLPLPRLPFAALLYGLLLAAALPTLLVSGIAVWQTVTAGRTAVEDRLGDVVRGIAVAVDREFLGATAAMSAFATSPAFGADPLRPDTTLLYAQARRVAEQLGAEIFVVRADGTRVLATRAPLGSVLPAVANQAVLDTVFATGRPAVGDVGVGSVSRKFTFTVGVPVSGQGGKTVLMAAASFDPAHMHDVLAAARMPAGAFAALADSRNIIVARSDALHERLVGAPVTAAGVAATAGSQSGQYRAVGRDGGAYIFTFEKLSAAPGWTLWVASPAEPIDAAWQVPVRELLIGGAFALLLGGLLAALSTRHILSSVRRLTRQASALAMGNPEDPPRWRSSIRELEVLRHGMLAAHAATGARVQAEREAAAARAESEARLRELVATMDLGVFMARDLDGTIRHWSLGCERLYGWTAQQAVGQVSHDLLRTVFPEPLKYIDATLRRGRPWAGELRHRTKDGRQVIVAARKVLRPAADGQPQTVLESLVEVTAQRQAEAALAQSEARFRALVGAMPQLAYSALPDGRTDFLNARWYDYTGVAAGASQPDGWAAALHPEDVGPALAEWHHCLSTGQPFETEFRLRGADGVYRHFLSRAVPLFDENGQVERWFGTATDISDIVAARDERAAQASALERQVAERTRDLAETQARLAHAQRLEALGQLAGGIAHDFNNILQATSGGAAMIERRANDPERVRQLASMIAESAARGASITRRLLTFARRGALQAEPLDVRELLEGTRVVLLPALGASIAIALDVPDGLPPVLADRSQLETVLVNLATNARDAMPQGGRLTIGVGVETVAGACHPEGLAAGDYVRFEITDTGDGMTQAVLARAMEPFFTTKAQGKGTGLGLAMTRGFAQQSGGGVALRSAPGKGTVVRLWLPVAVQNAPEPTQPPTVAPPINAAGPPRILLVDDESAVRMVLADQLTETGYAVFQAPDAAAALGLVTGGFVPDLIVSDLTMPGMDGVALIQALHAQLPALPAILLTGYVGDTEFFTIGRDIDKGGFTLLRKPVAGSELADQIGVLLADPVS